jgi:hypothetical protein
MQQPAERPDSGVMIQQLRAEHSALDEKLQAYNRSLHLTPAEEAEVRRLKREKLAKKDRILFISQTLA